MKTTAQFNARLSTETITRIQILADVIGEKNVPAKPLSQSEVVTVAVNLLHDRHFGAAENNSEKKEKDRLTLYSTAL